jgi:TRAP-type uncharacterized transport system substrate-binding protein
MSAILRSLPFALLGVLLVAMLFGAVSYVLRQLDLLPPTELSIAAGAPGSAYHATAQAYREVLARDEITLTIRETRGSVENAALLAGDDPVDIALVQGGVPLEDAVRGLAALYLEPLWVFGAENLPDDPNAWTDLRVAAGSEGSGTRLVADHLAEITGAGALGAAMAVQLGGADAVDALMAGSVDVALFVAPAEADYLRELLVAEGLRLHPLAHSEALALRLPGARLVRLPSGILDYRRQLPESDLELVALVTRLVARDGLHPALVNRLIHAVVEVHAGRGIIPADASYPAATDLDVEAIGYAEQLLKDGFSPLEAFLPYWIVAQFNRVLLVVVPATLLLLPLLRLLPALYAAVLQRRVYRHYARVHEIDEALLLRQEDLSAERLKALQAELDTIERKLLRTNLPNSYRKQAYTLLHHVDYVRKRSEELLKEQSSAA